MAKPETPLLTRDEGLMSARRVLPAMGAVFAAIEAYPELKASANVMHLQRALAETEEQIAAARRFFNAAVTSYNDAVQSFPGSLVAGAFGFAKRDWFATDAAERARPDATFTER